MLQQQESVTWDDPGHGQYLTSFQRKHLLKSLHTELRSEYRRRIEIMLLADMGQSQTQICDTLGCSQETARYWITMTQTGQAHTWNDRPIGRPKTVNDQYLERLKELVSHSPRDYGYPFKTWTARWLSKHLADELGIEISDRHINRLLKEMGLSSSSRRRQAMNAHGAQPHAKEANIVIGNLGNLKPTSTTSAPSLWLFKAT